MHRRVDVFICKIFEWFFNAYPYFHAAHEFALHRKRKRRTKYVWAEKLNSLFLEVRCVLTKSHPIIAYSLVLILLSLVSPPTRAHTIHFEFIAVLQSRRINCWILNLGFFFSTFAVGFFYSFSLSFAPTVSSTSHRGKKFKQPAAEISRIFLSVEE